MRGATAWGAVLTERELPRRPARWPLRRLPYLIAGWLVLALACASPAAAVDPGAVKLDRKTGCPLFYFPTQPQSKPSPLLFPQHGEHCFQMGAPSVLPLQRFFPSSTPGGAGACAGSLLVQEAIPKGTDDYVILPFSDIGLGTQILRPPGQQSIPIFNGADTYRAPRGSRVWGLGGGSSGGPCQTWDTHVFNPEAFGVTFKYEVSGKITELGSTDGVSDVTVQAKCNGGGTTKTDDKGEYSFLVDKGPCTIEPHPPKGEKLVPKRHSFFVNHDFKHVDFEIQQPILFFKVSEGLSVGQRTPGGHKLIKAGTNFTERVTFKNRSFTKTVLVAPMFPEVSGNVEGGALQPVGGTVQRKVSDLKVTDPSQFVLLHPREKKEYDAVFATVSSSSLGFYAGTKPAYPGTRGYIQFSVPVARFVESGFKLKPVPRTDIQIAKGSTDKTTVHVDDSAPDQAPFNAYLATYDVSKGVLFGLWHVTYGLVTGIKDFATLFGKGIASVPTGVMNYLKLEAELWQEVKNDPVQRALFMNVVTNQLLVMYKEAPFLLSKVHDLYGAVDNAVANHLNQVEHDVYAGDWERGYTQLADDGTQLVGNVGTLFVNPVKVAAPLAGAVMPRVAPLLEGLYAADKTEIAAEAATLDRAAAAAAEGEQTAQGAVAVLRKLRPGLAELTVEELANYFGISAQQYADLAKFCTENKLLVTLRSRAQEAIDLVERGIAYVKPAAIKLKTVNLDDIKYLGYPAEVTTASGEKVSSVGQVMILQPKYRSLREFRSAMQAQGVALDSAKYAKLEARWTQRMLEWLDPDKGYIKDLLNAADKDHSLTLDWHWGENHIAPELQAKYPPETVAFRMLKDPASGALLPQVNAGAGWRSITGDVDLVSVTHADGSALTDEQYTEMLKKLGATSVQTQHPATATWYLDVDDETSIFDPSDPLFKDKAKYMQANECCVMQVGPDGFVAAVELRLEGSWFIDKNNYYLDYLGGYKMSTR